MKKLLLIMLISIPALVVGQETVKYDYMTIVQRGDIIAISEGENYEIIKIKKEKEGADDYRPILKMAEAFELESWQVYEVDMGEAYGYVRLAFIMRREKGYAGNEDK
ncbi:hypothetical protein O3Q51_08255 [Cryomorphaceae bacterium 1068]|nr:hypothetical protein [Cryomorphaceae bacterium 1068]